MLLAAVENMQYAVTVDVLHTVMECILLGSFLVIRSDTCSVRLI